MPEQEDISIDAQWRDKLEIDYYFDSLNYWRIRGDDSDNNRKIRIFIGIINF